MKTNLYDLLSTNGFLYWASIPTQLLLLLLHTALKPNYRLNLKLKMVDVLVGADFKP